MGEVNLIIQGESYAIACDPGQEKRVAALGRYLDQQVGEIAKSGAATDRARQLVLTGLILADRIDELEVALEEASSQPAQVIYEAAPAPIPQRVSEDDETEIVAAINQLASRIDSVAERLQKI